MSGMPDSMHASTAVAVCGVAYVSCQAVPTGRLLQRLLPMSTFSADSTLFRGRAGAHPVAAHSQWSCFTHLRHAWVAVVQAVCLGAVGDAHVVAVQRHTHVKLAEGGDAIPEETAGSSSSSRPEGGVSGL